MAQKNLNSSSIRLNKYLAQLGVASRRKADELIIAGKIIVNGKIIIELGTKINPDKDQIEVNGKKINTKLEDLTYIILNKPKGYFSTTSDPYAKRTILDLLKSPIKKGQVAGRGVLPRLYPVGRLDQDSHGLILLTNDGDLTYKLTHPKYHIPKVYIVTILGFVTDQNISNLTKGVLLDDGKTKPCKIKIINRNPRQTQLEIILYEGKKRQIRRMCAALHLHLTDLQRIAIGRLKLGKLGLGKWKYLSTEEVKILL